MIFICPESGMSARSFVLRSVIELLTRESNVEMDIDFDESGLNLTESDCARPWGVARQ
jgi:hypothetical protein